MKRNILPLVLVATLALGGYFFWFYEEGKPKDSEKDTFPADSVASDTVVPGTDAIQQRKMKEEAMPQRFLGIDCQKPNRILRIGLVHGQVRNLAEFTTYSQIEVKVKFLTESGAVLDSSGVLLYERVAPGDSLSFEFKTKFPKGAASLIAEIGGAKAQPLE